MTTILHWPLEMPQYPAVSYAGGPLNNRESFSARAGEPIERPITTAPLEVYDMNTKPITKAVFAIFEAWFRDDLKSGTNWFSMRHPIGREIRETRIVGASPAYTVSPLSGGRLVSLSMQLMFRPLVPWFADYVPPNVSRPPSFVADYANGVYGINGALVPVSSLPTITGTYGVERRTTTSISFAYETLTAGAIPQAQPVNTNAILGFPA